MITAPRLTSAVGSGNGTWSMRTVGKAWFSSGSGLALSFGALLYLLRRGGRRLDESAKVMLRLVGITLLPCLLQIYFFASTRCSIPFQLEFPFWPSRDGQDTPIRGSGARSSSSSHDRCSVRSRLGR